jgi:hypothetical protein
LPFARIVTAATPTGSDPGAWLDSLGPFVAFGGLSIYCLFQLWRFVGTLRSDHAAEKAALIAQHEAEKAAMRAEHEREMAEAQRQNEDYKKREREQADKAIVQSERVLPVMEAGTALIQKMGDRLERGDR